MPASPDSAQIWVTRPLPVAERTAENVKALGLTPLIAPLLTIQALPAHLPPMPPKPKGWIFTSRHAPHALRALLAQHGTGSADLEELRNLPAWCVGTRTAEAAIAMGFPMAQFMGESGVAMGRRLGSRLESLRGPRNLPYDLWYAASRTRRYDLHALLSPWEVNVRVIELYESQPAITLPPVVEVSLRTGKLKAVLLYSPETARAFARTLARSGMEAQASVLPVFCLSAAVAEALPAAYTQRIVATHPSESFLLQSLDAWAKSA